MISFLQSDPKGNYAVKVGNLQGIKCLRLTQCVKVCKKGLGES